MRYAYRFRYGMASDMEVNVNHESGYRRGYTDGVSEMLAAVRNHLPADKMKKLEKWESGQLLKWRFDPIADLKLPPDTPAL